MKAIQECLEQRGGANPQSRPPVTTGSRRSTVCWKCHQSGHIRRDCKQGDGEPANPAPISSNPAVTPWPSLSSPGSNGPQAPPVPINVTSVYKTGSSFNSCDGLLVDGAIGGTQCRITIDTGSNISIVRSDILQPGAQVQPVSSYLSTVTGATAPIRGRGDFTLHLGGLQTAHSMSIADIADQCILGLDWTSWNPMDVELTLETSRFLCRSQFIPSQHATKYSPQGSVIL